MVHESSDRHVFALRAPFRDPFRRKVFGMMRRSVERLFYLDQMNRIYEAAGRLREGEDFIDAAVRAMGVTTEVCEADFQCIPREGGVMVVANHPFGGIEGLVLLRMLRRVRPDVKFLANYLLKRMPEMDPYSIFVNPFGGRHASKANVAAMKSGIRWLREGHMLLVFPSGEVSYLHLQRREVTDPLWSESIARMIRRGRAAALPVFVEGRNSALFQMMGLVHPRLRTALLPRELYRRKGTCLRFRVGSTVPFAKLDAIEGDREMIDYLQLRTYILKGRTPDGGDAAARQIGLPADRMTPVAEPLYPETLARDILLLPPECQLLETDDYAVYAVRADQIPNVLHEIGRLREITFRGVGEGTGREIDLDRFDRYYHHLLLWSRKKNELVGAYRIGKSDEILAHYGKRGLYTSTLFRYRRKLLHTMGPALELGRSFIRAEYQRNYASLLLLWKGIGRMVLREPKYRHLFGPVSINNEYNTLSRQMLEVFLRANNFRTDWARYVKPRHHPRRPNAKRWNPELFRRSIKDPEEISELIAEIERGRKGVPVLLKQYLKLGGKLLGFNVDPGFCDVLDGLIWVDLLDTDPRILIRFLGRAESAAFLRHHGRELEGGSSTAAAGGDSRTKGDTDG